jgi:hypothetical protein
LGILAERFGLENAWRWSMLVAAAFTFSKVRAGSCQFRAILIQVPLSLPRGSFKLYIWLYDLFRVCSAFSTYHQTVCASSDTLRHALWHSSGIVHSPGIYGSLSEIKGGFAGLRIPETRDRPMYPIKRHEQGIGTRSGVIA